MAQKRTRDVTDPKPERGGTGSGSGRMLSAMRLAWLPVVLAACLPVYAQAPPAACALDVSIATSDGSPPPAGLTIQAASEGGGHREAALLEGRSVVGFEDLTCGAVQVVVVGASTGAIGAVPVVQGAGSVLLSPGVRGGLTVAIPALQRLTVRVEDRAGEAVRDGMVSAWHVRDSSGEPSRNGIGTPDGAGIVSMFLERGRYQVRYRAHGQRAVLEATVDGVPSGPEPVVDVASRPVEVVFKTSNAFVIVGAVRMADGAPLPRVAVDVYAGGAVRCAACARTDAAGRFELGLAELPAELGVTEPSGRYVFDPSRVAVGEGDLGREVLFVASDAGARRLRGQVTADGAPVGGARVFGIPKCPAESAPASPFGFVQSDDAGRFDVPCPEGCGLQLSVAPPSGSAFSAARWEGTDDDCNREVQIALERGLEIRGRVRDAKRKPVEGLQLSLEPQWRRGGATTDTEGRFVFEGLSEGAHVVAVRGAPGVDRVLTREDGSAPEVEVRRGVDPEDLELRWVPGGRACVTILDPDGAEIPLRSLEAHRRGVDGSPWRSRTPRADLRDHPGELCVGPLPAGPYELFVGHLAEPFVPVWWPGEPERRYALPVEVKAGETARLGPMTILPAGRIDVVLDGAVPTEGAAVEFDVRAVPQPREAEAQPSEEEPPPPWVAFAPERVRRGDERPSQGRGERPGAALRAAIRETRRGSERSEAPADPRERFRLWAVPVGHFDLRACAGPKGCDGGQVWCTAQPIDLEADRTLEVTLQPAGEAGCPVRQPSAENGEQHDPEHRDGEPHE